MPRLVSGFDKLKMVRSVKLLISEAARAFRDDGAQDFDIVSPRADASLAVQSVNNVIELFLGNVSEICPFGEVSPKQSIGVFVGGKWKYLFRAVDKQGRLINFMLSDRRNTKAARRFLAKALKVMRHWPPVSITTDKNPAYGEAIAELKKEGRLPKDTQHRQVKYLNNRLECDHGKPKRLIQPPLGFQSMKTAYATIKGFEVMRMFKKGQFTAWIDALGCSCGTRERRQPQVLRQRVSVDDVVRSRRATPARQRSPQPHRQYARRRQQVPIIGEGQGVYSFELVCRAEPRRLSLTGCSAFMREPPVRSGLHATRLDFCNKADFCNGALLYVRRAQRTYSVRSLIQNPLERARTEVKLAPGFLVRSAPKPRRVVDRVGA